MTDRLAPARGLAEIQLGRQRSPQHATGPYMRPYLRAANVKDGVLDLSDVKEMNFTPDEQELFQLRPGDVLVSEGAGSLAAVGTTAIYDGDPPGVCFQNTLLRLRPRDEVDPRFVAWWARGMYTSGEFARLATGASIYHLGAERVRAMRAWIPPIDEQRRIAVFLDTETERIDQLIATKTRIIELLNARIDSQVMTFVGRSSLAGKSEIPTTPIKRQLHKLERSATEGEMITAFRDGQVTSRAARGRDGFTDSWTDNARVQVVDTGDIVVHGLDGFSGAIGDAEVDGVCSPVNHVCRPREGDSTFLARMLRLLALCGYLGNFATSTRERAVDFRNWDLFGRIPIPRVPVEDQCRVGAEIRALRPLQELVTRTQALANERRRSLITAAVTGEMSIQ